MKTVSEQIRYFVEESGISLRELKNISGVSASDIMQWWSLGKNVFRDQHVRNIEKCLGLPLAKLLQKKYLKLSFHEHFRNDKVNICSEYSNDARSFVRTSGHIVKYLELMYGCNFVHSKLKKMGVHAMYFENHNHKINIKFFIDILELCREMGFRHEDLRRLSAAMFLSMEGTESEKFFPKCKTYQEVYEAIARVIPNFDRNFYYNFQIFENRVEILAEPHDLIVPFLEASRLDFLFQYRKEIFGTLPLMYGMNEIVLNLAPTKCSRSLTQRYVGFFPNSSRFRHLQFV